MRAVDPTLPIAPEHTLGFFFLPSELSKAYYFPILVEFFSQVPPKLWFLSIIASTFWLKSVSLRQSHSRSRCHLQISKRLYPMLAG